MCFNKMKWRERKGREGERDREHGTEKDWFSRLCFCNDGRCWRGSPQVTAQVCWRQCVQLNVLTNRCKTHTLPYRRALGFQNRTCSKQLGPKWPASLSVNGKQTRFGVCLSDVTQISHSCTKTRTAIVTSQQALLLGSKTMLLNGFVHLNSDNYIIVHLLSCQYQPTYMTS